MIYIEDATILDNYIIRNLYGSFRKMLTDRTTAVYFAILLGVLLLGVVGPTLAPYDHEKRFYAEDGSLMRSEPPSIAHPMGTTAGGYDVFSRLLVGARPTVITGLLGGTMIIGIGMSIGVTAGYIGGYVDTILMRLTDVVYGVPLIPFAIVLLGYFEIGFFKSIMVIGLLLWRGNARVLRSEVLQIKEKPFILSAKATGAGPLRIIGKHILPNTASMAVLFFALGIGYSIILQAGLAFLGVSSPFVPSWGVMIRNAFQSGSMASAWWWSIPPGLLISVTVLSTFMFGRGYESITGADETDAFAKAG